MKIQRENQIFLVRFADSAEIMIFMLAWQLHLAAEIKNLRSTAVVRARTIRIQISQIQNSILLFSFQSD
eukprot:SAG25_NODE_690_length_5919_cov_13.007045_10_plen_69_part_00